mgnify:FL=1
MTVELELIIKIFGGAVSVSIGVFVWWFKGWIETNVTKPQNENKVFNEKVLTAIDEVNKKVEKISQIQDGRKGVLTPIEVMVEQTFETVNHIADIQDAQFQLDGQARFECDGNGYLNKANFEFQKLVGKSIDQLLGNQWMRVIRHEQQDNFVKSWERLTQSGIPLNEVVATDKAKIQITAIKKPDDNGSIKVIIGAVKQVA